MTEDGDNADLLMLVFSKAFDRANLGIFKNKLKANGIVGELETWISEFLSEKLQCVTVSNLLARWAKVVSGLPQEAVLGAVLRLLSFLKKHPPL